jgi:hypothetical protein
VDVDVHALTLARLAALALLLAPLACALTYPIVQTQVMQVSPGLLAKVAVAPFTPAPGLRPRSDPPVSAALAAELVTRFVAEALAAHGIAVVAPNDLVLAFESQGMVLPRNDAAALAAVAASQFGATGLIVGSVTRYQEREGGARGALRPAGVGFSFTLHAAPGGATAYRARFDHTQTALSQDLFGSLRYPGGGSRWLTVAELARWGADNAVEEMPGGLR